MDCFAGDLCALSELSDSTLLNCIQNRHKKGLTQTYVGEVLLCVRPEHPLLSAENQLIQGLASKVLRNAIFHKEEHTIVLYGCHGSGKTFLAHQLLVTLLAGLTKHPNCTRIAEGSQLLSLLTQCKGEERNQLLMRVKLFIDRKDLAGCHFSCLLLDPTNLERFKVFQLMDNGDDQRVEKKLESIGLPQPLRAEFMSLLNAIHSLCYDADPTQLSNLLGISQDCISCIVEEGYRLAEQLYSYLVRWLVSWLNMELGLPTEESKHCCSVSIVDPPGTQTGNGSSTQHDSLHHLVTRYINEVLHNIFCLRLFVWEQEQYMEEGIEWEFVDVQFNQPLVDTFHRPTGLLFSAGMPSISDAKEAVHACCEKSANTCFTTEDGSFVVTHFTGECSYKVDEQWIASNNRITAVSDNHSLMQVLLTSSNQLLKQIVESFHVSSPDVIPGLSNKAISLTQRAREGMAILSESITTSHPHFVLCMAPVPLNSNKECSFDGEYMLSQLQHLRILDTALIQSCGYPTRIEHFIFVKKYSHLLLRSKLNEDDRNICEDILKNANLQDYQVGDTQVLLKPWHLHQLDDIVEGLQTSAKKIQQAFRRTLRRRSEQLQMMQLTYQPASILEEEEEDSDETHSGSEESQQYSFPPVRKNILDNSSSDESEEYPSPTAPRRMVPPTPPPRPQHTLSEPLLPLHMMNTTHRRGNGYIHKKIESDHETATHALTFPKTKIRKKPSWGKSTKAFGSPAHSHPISSEVVRHPWNHGKISREKAELRLKAATKDCYLVRESEKRVGEYSLSVKHKDIIKHFRIDTKRASHIRYELFGAQRSFPSLTELVDYYSQHCITKDGELLTVPCVLEGSASDSAPPLPPRKKNLSTIRRTKPPSLQMPRAEPHHKHTQSRPPMTRAHTTEVESIRPHHTSADFFFDLSDDSIALLRKELDIEERIVEAARRMFEMPSGSRKAKQRRKQSLQQAQSRLLSLRKQYHELQDRRRFLETTMQNVSFTNRRISEPVPPTPPPRPLIV